MDARRWLRLVASGITRGEDDGVFRTVRRVGSFNLDQIIG